MGEGLLVLLVLGLDAGTAAGQVLQATRRQADQVQPLVLVQSAPPAGEVLDGDWSRRLRLR
jgi:hypothetical protein